MSGVEPARVFASMERRWGALGTFAVDAVGDLRARPQLSRRDRSLLVLAILAAQARDEELELHTLIMVHLCLYAGFPKAVDGIRAVQAAFARIDARAAERGLR